jgi:hypothetical protein
MPIARKRPVASGLRFIYYHGGQTHPRELNEKQIETFLSHLVDDVKASAATRRQALIALVFLFILDAGSSSA